MIYPWGVAFQKMGANYCAGSVYLNNLFHALNQNFSEKLKLFIFEASISKSQDSSHELNLEKILHYHRPKRGSLKWFAFRTISRLCRRELGVERYLRGQNIKALFGPMVTYRLGSIATLSWFFDFQHVHHPEFFSDKERISRDRYFLESSRYATKIILLSRTVQKDFESFIPHFAYKACPLSPVSFIPQDAYKRDVSSILKIYQLPQKFFYLPNQFWKHKNHEVVFQALRILKDKGEKFLVVCTGSRNDYRFPKRFEELGDMIHKWRIKDCVRFLDIIPHDDVLMLMRQSICVVNPSFFEGWGLSVDEARSLGKQVLVSDIPVHREQNPPKVHYFNPYDEVALSLKMQEVWSSTVPGPDFGLEIEARKELPQRIRGFADTFFSVLQDAICEISKSN